jgi:hypothetical protein
VVGWVDNGVTPEVVEAVVEAQRRPVTTMVRATATAHTMASARIGQWVGWGGGGARIVVEALMVGGRVRSFS